MIALAQQIATDLLQIGAVSLSPDEPFTWASGIKSPIYTDNRVTIGYPAVRSRIAAGLAQQIISAYPDVEVIGGVATAGIPHAALVAQLLNLPMIYVRSKPKDHGQGQQIEGPLEAGAKVVLIDDLLSTGGSVLQAVSAAQTAGAEVLGVAAIFTYELPDNVKNFDQASIPFVTLTNYSSLIAVAEQQGRITAQQLASLQRWRQDPHHWPQENH
ncbi:orotate phosphoribosyltransferase [Lacticaseibacillus brantae]|uniref:Orotate phosphoribosyltransferase n=1 Tax=Lacticaseibacillus brantae DSM 23927 TaxID=1423727 RepID=A0A0R2B1L2_9LACO|nr:orotate phosphoribosyltransferase [Lacticaseibacillus brantae]KRM72642.1 orotate phosphoribosyltransferase [Lacticaseibacillus brantae DSM 23927]